MRNCNLVATGMNIPHKFDTNQPIKGGSTVRTMYGNKTVLALHVGTRLAMHNLSGDGRPDLVCTISGYDYRDPERCGAATMPCYVLECDDGDRDQVAIMDVADPKGQWRALP